MRLVRPFETLFLLCAVLAGVGVSLWLAIWSPDALLRDPLPLYRQGAATSSPEIIGTRDIRHIRLVGPDEETVPFQVSLPHDLSTAVVPIVVIVNGLSGQPDPIKHVTHPGPNAIVVYQPPLETENSTESTFPVGAWDARSRIYRMPEEVSAILAWVGRQEWADKKRINLVGIGWGAVMLPAIRRRAGATGRPINASVFINGGTDIASLASANLDISARWLRHPAAWVADFMLRPLAPETHLPEIAGPFLIITAPDAPAIPEASRTGLEALLPSPKTMASVARGDDTPAAYYQRVIRVAQNWLVAQGAVNP